VEPPAPTLAPPEPPPGVELPAGFAQYVDPASGVSLFLPEGWTADTPPDPPHSQPRTIILRSYPADKYVGGEGFRPGDTKCDLTVHLPGTRATDVIQRIKSAPLTTIVSEEEIVLQSGNQTSRWTGVITRAMGEIDPRNRTARVVVTVTDTVSADANGTSLLRELLPGMFVEVGLQGAELHDVIALPRGALHDNETVWTVDSDNRLHIRPVEIIRRERENLLVEAGQLDGLRAVLPILTGAADGMLLRPQLREER
jgi:hypothetical protein